MCSQFKTKKQGKKISKKHPKYKVGDIIELNDDVVHLLLKICDFNSRDYYIRCTKIFRKLQTSYWDVGDEYLFGIGVIDNSIDFSLYCNLSKKVEKCLKLR
jgi:hypothetical protein